MTCLIISHKNRENQEKWEEKGKIGQKMGSLPLRTGRAGYGPEYPLYISIYLFEKYIKIVMVIHFLLFLSPHREQNTVSNQRPDDHII